MFSSLSKTALVLVVFSNITTLNAQDIKIVAPTAPIAEQVNTTQNINNSSVPTVVDESSIKTEKIETKEVPPANVPAETPTETPKASVPSTPTIAPTVSPMPTATEATSVSATPLTTDAPQVQATPTEIESTSPADTPTATAEALPENKATTDDVDLAVNKTTTSITPFRFSLRGFYSFGKFTTISDISTNYSLGTAVGYDLNSLIKLEVQFSYSQYEDRYVYSSGTPVSGYKFNQKDLAAILNYTLLTEDQYKVYARGGLNHSSRSARNLFTGSNNSSTSVGLVLGLGADFKIADNLSVTGSLDYIFSLTSSGYNNVSSPLYLVENESFRTFNIGLKYNF